MIKLTELVDDFIEKLQKIKQEADSMVVVGSIDGMVLTNTYDANFKSNKITAQDIRKYCKGQGFKIDRIFFLDVFDLEEKEEMNNFKAKSDSRLFVLKNKNEYEAYFFINSKIKIT